MTHEKGKFLVTGEISAITEQMSPQPADRSKVAHQQPERLAGRVWKADMVAHEGGDFRRIVISLIGGSNDSLTCCYKCFYHTYASESGAT
jgi:hypothetical protein